MKCRKSERVTRFVTRSLGSVVVFALVMTAGSVAAQSVPTGYQDYFVLGYEQHVWDMMQKVRTGEVGGTFTSGMNSVVTAVASADNQVVYYDQWEDGLEGDILIPVQTTTLVLGDGDPNNGRACDFTTDPRIAPCSDPGKPDDTLFEGTFLTLNSDQGLGGCTTIDCSVPLNPRNPAQIRFDGGDRIVTSGGPLSVIHNQNPMTQYIGGATENISFQTVEDARSYSIPIGEDSYSGFGSATQPFKYVDIGLVAFEDDTAVFIDSPNGGGTVSFTLDRGQSYTSLGEIDGSPAPAITINAGTKVSTDKGITGFIHTGGDGTYATRFYTLLPDLLHATDYVITAPGDNPTQPPGTQDDRPANIYIFNPDPLNTIVVSTADSVGTDTVTIPPNSSVAYSIDPGRDVPPDSTIRMVSDRRFWGVSAYDYTTHTSDWGHSWLARRFLTGIYTVGWAPGSVDLSVNRSPVYVSATQDNTRVQIDLDNDEVFDQVDLNGNGAADPPDILAGNIYLVHALEALSVFDHNDYDNTGTRIVANKPVAVAWGQETDLGVLNDPSLDTGYTIYPINQLFLDPVLTIEKQADSETVPLAGGVVTYTLTVSSYGHGGLEDLEVWDVLPSGVTASTDYVVGSTLITFPNLTQQTDDPTFSVDPETGRDRLDWALDQTTIGSNQYITVQYSILMPPAGSPGLLTNTGHAQGRIGTSYFNPISLESVVQTDATLSKTVSHDGTPEVGEPVHYALTVENTGQSNETGVVITDPIPPDTTFQTGSIVNDGPFNGSYDPDQNAVVWTATLFTAGTGPFVLEFDAVINPGVEAETAVLNEAGYESAQTPYFVARANLETTGPSLEYEKHGPAVLHPNETAVFDIVVRNTGLAEAADLTVVDQIPLFTTYAADSMEWSLNSAPFVPLTDSVDTDQGAFLTDHVEFSVASLGPGEDLVFRFRVVVDPNTTGEFVNNQATVYSGEIPPGDTSLVQIPIVGDAEVTGHVFLDVDGDGTQDPGEPDLGFVDVVVVDSQGNTQIVTTDSDGDYSVIVEAGSTSVDVDETDPDFPVGAGLTTGNDPQNVTAVSGATRSATPVGYEPPPLSFSKVSDAPDSTVVPGQVVTYTIELTNNTAVAQTGINIQDPLPANTSYVAGSSQVLIPSTPKFRVTEYWLDPAGGFTGNTYDLTLDQNLAADYFVMVRGSDGNGGDGNGDRRGPFENYVSLTSDPNGTGDLTASGATNRLSFTRRGNDDNWTGVFTVVECLADCTTDGFVLVDVDRINHTGSSSGTANLPTTGASWSNINQVLLMGGHNGAGCDSTETDNNRHHGCHVRFVPSGSDEIDWSRRGNSSGWNAISTVMAVEWGSNWTVQNVRVQGNNGGNNANEYDEYNVSTIPTEVVRANTWVWGSGFTSDNGIGDTAEGCLIALGNGIDQNPSEDEVAVGLEYSGNAVDFQVYAMTHADMVTDHEFKPVGHNNQLIADVGVDAAGAERMALAYNGMGSTSSGDWPASIFSARYLDDSTIRMQRRFSDYSFPAWLQGADFSNFLSAVAAPGGDPPNLVVPSDGYTIAPGSSLIVTFQVVVDSDLATGVTQISNTAEAWTVEQTTHIFATATDDVIRVGVTVEPDNSGYGRPGDSLTYYSHVVTNTGDRTDSFDITGQTGLNWPVDLIDTATGAVLAEDHDGDGVWDNGVTINTGSLPPGASVNYDYRVTIPLGTPIGTRQSASLTATSVRNPLVSADAADETLVVDTLGDIIITPDNTGIVSSPGTIAYAHHVINLTGNPDTIDLSVNNSQSSGWTSQIYWDTNGDGEYTPGVDLEISNTRQLQDGESQLIFVVVTADAGLAHGSVNVSNVGAVSRNDPAVADGATDTTTVLSGPIDFDLSGGGTRQVTPGTTSVFPGQLRNLGEVDDVYDFTLSPAGYYGIDAFDHPTRLVIDTTGNGIPDTLIGEDLEGDGVWDFIEPGYDSDGDGSPDVGVTAGGSLAYELRRPVDPAQQPYRDPVTLTARPQSQTTPPIDSDSVTATNILLTESYAVIASFETYSADGKVMVEWRTAAEVGTVGFDLYRSDGDISGAVRVNQEPLRAVLHSPQGGLYRFLDATATAGVPAEYVVVERDAWGGSRRLGPFAVTADELAASDPRRSDVAWTGAYRPSRRQSRVREPGRLLDDPSGTPTGKAKIAVGRDSLVWVASTELASVLNVDESMVTKAVQKGWLRLTCRNEEIAWAPEEGGAGFYFFGEGLDSIYSNDNVYWVEIDAGETMTALTGKPPLPQLGGSFKESLHFEQEHQPVTDVITDPEGDFWMWDGLIPGYPGYAIKQFAFRTPDVSAVEGMAKIEIALQGGVDAAVDPDHHVRIRVNDKLLGEPKWDGTQSLTVAYLVPPELLEIEDNTLEIEAVPVPGVDLDYVFLDAFDVRYRREFRADDNRLIFEAAADRVVTVEGFSTGQIEVFDLSDRMRPAIVAAKTVKLLSSGYSVSFKTGQEPSEYLAVVPATVQGPQAISRDFQSDLRSVDNEAEYLIIAASGLEGTAQTLADYRSSTGLVAQVVPIDDIYDEFSHGIENPWAIRDFIEYTVGRWATPPRYVVLVGDGSHDYLDRLGDGGNQVPSPQVSTSNGLFASDHLLADFVGNDGAPEVALGRLPVRTAGELSAVIDKIIAFENSDPWWKQNTLWVADFPDHGGEFSTGLTKLISRLAPWYLAYRIDLEVTGITMGRQLLAERINTGAGFVGFLGHGGLDRLASLGVLTTDDVPNLANEERAPVVTALTCVVGRFDVVAYDTLAEALLMRPDGGAIAVWSPTGLVLNQDSLQLGTLFNDAISSESNMRLGDAVRTALHGYAGSPSADPTVPYLYVLLGDPALVIRTDR